MVTSLFRKLLVGVLALSASAVLAGKGRADDSSPEDRAARRNLNSGAAESRGSLPDPGGVVTSEPGPASPVGTDAAPGVDMAALSEEKAHLGLAEDLDAQAQTDRDRATSAPDRQRLIDEATKLEGRAKRERELAQRARARVFGGSQ